MEKPMVVQELSKMIATYLEGGRNRNLNRMARETGVAYVTLRRIAQAEVASVSLENAVAILTAVGERDSDKIMELVERWFPESSKIFREFHEKMNSGKVVDKSMLDLIPDYPSWVAMCLAERQSGVSMPHLIDILGVRSASEAVEALEANEAVEMRDRRFHLRDKNFTASGNLKFVMAEIRHMTEAYDYKRRSDPGHLVSSVVTGLNTEGLVRLRDVLRRAAVEVADIANDQKLRGEEVAFCGIIGGTFAKFEGDQE
jgi:hypothetical protein